MSISKQEFEQKYISKSNNCEQFTKADYDKFYITLPCVCDFEKCCGWAAVDNNKQSIAHHNEFYGGEV